MFGHDARCRVSHPERIVGRWISRAAPALEISLLPYLLLGLALRYARW